MPNGWMLLWKWEIALLSHVVSKEGIEVDPSQTENVTIGQRPLEIGQLQFLRGFYNYFHNFNYGYSTLVAPLWHEERLISFGERVVNVPLKC